MLSGFRFTLIYTLLAGGSFLMLAATHSYNPLLLPQYITLVFASFCLLKSLLEVERIEKIHSFVCSLLLVTIYVKLGFYFFSAYLLIQVLLVSVYLIWKNNPSTSKKRMTSLAIVACIVGFIPDSVYWDYLNYLSTEFY